MENIDTSKFDRVIQYFNWNLKDAELLDFLKKDIVSTVNLDADFRPPEELGRPISESLHEEYLQREPSIDEHYFGVSRYVFSEDGSAEVTPMSVFCLENYVPYKSLDLFIAKETPFDIATGRTRFRVDSSVIPENISSTMDFLYNDVRKGEKPVHLECKTETSPILLTPVAYIQVRRFPGRYGTGVNRGHDILDNDKIYALDELKELKSSIVRRGFGDKLEFNHH